MAKPLYIVGPTRWVSQWPVISAFHMCSMFVCLMVCVCVCVWCECVLAVWCVRADLEYIGLLLPIRSFLVCLFFPFADTFAISSMHAVCACECTVCCEDKYHQPASQPQRALGLRNAQWSNWPNKQMDILHRNHWPVAVIILRIIICLM